MTSTMILNTMMMLITAFGASVRKTRAAPTNIKTLLRGTEGNRQFRLCYTVAGTSLGRRSGLDSTESE